MNATHAKTPQCSRSVLVRIGSLLVGFAALTAAPTKAHAFPTYSRVSEGCHEQITMDALRAARTATAPARPLTPVTRDDRAFIDDLPFDTAGDMKDLGAVALLTGVRYNDLKGRAPNEIDQLAQIHGDPSSQAEHCLRSPSQDEPNGSQAALAECRAFIRSKVADALEGLDAAGFPDVNLRVTMDVDLSLRGGVEAPLPRYYARLGEALHAVQDGFTHTYRNSDRTKVVTVLNYMEYVEDELEPARDGPAHKSELDRCDDPDEMRMKNRLLATEATHEIIAATLDTSLSKEQRMARVDAIFDKYFTLEPGCTHDNAWCGAPEEALPESSACACATVGKTESRDPLVALAPLAIAIAFARRVTRGRPRGARAKRADRVVASVLVLCAAFGARESAARAQTVSPSTPTTTDVAPTTPASAAPSTAPAAPASSLVPPAPTPPAEPPTSVTAELPKVDPDVDPAPSLTPTTLSAAARENLCNEGLDTKEREHNSPFGVYLAGAGSVSNPAVAGMVGLRFRLSEHFVLGLDGELNGWYGIHSGRMRTGATSIYASLIVRFPLQFKPVNLRAAAELGTAIQMVDLFGAPKGSVGIFAGLNPLGIEWKLTGHLYAIFYPLGVAVPAPQLKGAPFAYPQYRSTLGLEWSF